MPERSERGVLWWTVVVIIVAALTLPLWLPVVGRWYACQQLAPIERAFVRGC